MAFTSYGNKVYASIKDLPQYTSIGNGDKIIIWNESRDGAATIDYADFIIDLLKDVELEQMSLEDQYNYIMRRWYDKNIKVSHAIEYLRLSPKELRRETALKVLDYLEELKKES